MTNVPKNVTSGTVGYKQKHLIVYGNVISNFTSQVSPTKFVFVIINYIAGLFPGYRCASWACKVLGANPSRSN